MVRMGNQAVMALSMLSIKPVIVMIKIILVGAALPAMEGAIQVPPGGTLITIAAIPVRMERAGLQVLTSGWGETEAVVHRVVLSEIVGVQVVTEEMAVEALLEETQVGALAQVVEVAELIAIEMVGPVIMEPQELLAQVPQLRLHLHQLHSINTTCLQAKVLMALMEQEEEAVKAEGVVPAKVAPSVLMAREVVAVAVAVVAKVVKPAQADSVVAAPLAFITQELEQGR